MKSFTHAFKEADLYYTPSCLVEILVPYLQKWSDDFIAHNGRYPVIWCPFDTPSSKYVEVLSKHGFDTTWSHIDTGQDFFLYEPDSWDIAVSNPPFSLKLNIFYRLNKLKKPYVMLMNMMAINYQEIGNLFYETGNSIQFIIPDKKISFNGHTSSFCSGYVCKDFIEKTEFVHMKDNNSGKFYRA